MDAVLDASSRQDGPVQTLGPLIHNPQALDLIGKRGVSVAPAPDQVGPGTVVIRAHGIPIQDLRGLKARQQAGELKLVNATCPEVAKVHSRIKKYSPKGYFTVILGIHGHAESMAHISFAEHGAKIVANMEEARALTDAEVRRVLIVAQTTFTVKDFQEISDYIRERSEDCLVENTICEDTWTRQEEAHRIAQTVDAVVVVGGKNSANTRHLVELVEHHGKPVQYVEVASELDLACYRGDETVGVLAGASTPTWLVEEVVDVLEHHGQRARMSGRALQEVLGRPALLAVGAACTTLGVSHWLGLPFQGLVPLMAGGYVLAMFILTSYLDPHGVGAKGPAAARLLRNNRALLLGLGLGALMLSLVSGWFLGPLPAAILMGAAVLGVAYKLEIPMGGQRYSLRSIPGSKDLLVAVAMAVVLVGIPVLHARHPLDAHVWAAMTFVGALGFARTCIQNLLDIQKDRILGRETLPILIGRTPAKWVMGVLLGLALLSAILTGPFRPFQALILTVSAGYPLFHMWFFHERFTAGQSRLEPPQELSLLLMGLLALV